MIVQELKKIFEIKRILLLLILGALFYVLFFQNNVGIPEYSSERVTMEIDRKLKEKYGAALDATEYEKLRLSFDASEESVIDRWILGRADYKEHGIESYRELWASLDVLSDDVAASLTSQVLNEFTDEEREAAQELAWTQEYAEGLLKSYETEVKSESLTSYYSDVPEKYEERMKERKDGEVRSLMPSGVMQKYLAILPDFAIFLFLSMILLVVPYSVKDTVEGVCTLQYTSKKGCKFYWRKAFAVLISAFFVCLAELLLFGLMISKNGVFDFTDMYVSGFGNPFISFVKLTFGQYLFFSLAYVTVMGLCFSMIVFWISGWARNYISAVAFQIPVIIFGMVVSLMLMPHFAEVTQRSYLLFLTPGICIFAAVLGNVGRYVVVRRWGRG